MPLKHLLLMVFSFLSLSAFAGQERYAEVYVDFGIEWCDKGPYGSSCDSIDQPDQYYRYVVPLTKNASGHWTGTSSKITLLRNLQAFVFEGYLTVTDSPDSKSVVLQARFHSEKISDPKAGPIDSQSDTLRISYNQASQAPPTYPTPELVGRPLEFPSESTRGATSVMTPGMAIYGADVMAQ